MAALSTGVSKSPPISISLSASFTPIGIAIPITEISGMWLLMLLSRKLTPSLMKVTGPLVLRLWYMRLIPETQFQRSLPLLFTVSSSLKVRSFCFCSRV